MRAARLSVAAGVATLFVVWLCRPLTGGDSGQLLIGSAALWRCLVHGHLIGCGSHTEGLNPPRLSVIGPFPVLQYPEGIVAHVFGRPGEQTYVLSLVSVAAFAASMAMTVLVLRRVGLAAWAWVVLAVVITGPLLAYASSSLGEMLATALLLFLVTATVVGAPPWVVGLAAVGAALTKETGYPYVAAIGLIGLYLLRGRTGMQVGSRLVWGGFGLAIGAACNAGLNVIRYGVLTNSEYLEAKYRASSLHVELDSFAGLFASPSGGLIFFWPSVVVLIGLLLACSLRHRRETLLLAAIVLALALVQVGLATWWAPFGWYAWGPRLTLPWMWPFVLLAIVAAARNAGPALGRILASPVRLAATACALLVTSLPTIGYLWRPEVVARFFSATSVACPPAVGPGDRQYTSCLHERMWSRHPLLLDGLHGLASAPAVLTVIAVAVVVTGSLILVRREQLAVVPDDAVNHSRQPALADR